MLNYKKGLCSVCCVGYNHANYLEKCIRSIWECDYKKVEIITLDDGSTDGSVGLLKTLAANSPFPMTVISQKNSGQVANNFNLILKMAKGEYLSIISLDDYLYPDALSKKINLMNTNDKIAFIFNFQTTVINSDGEIIKIQRSFRHGQTPTITEIEEAEFQNIGSFYLQGTVIRTEIINFIGGFDPDSVGDDIIFRTKLIRYIKEHPEYIFTFFDEPAFYYRLHKNNIHNNTLRQVHIVSEYLNRYWPNSDLPREYINMVKKMIYETNLEDSIKELIFNSTSCKLLLNPKVKRALIGSIILPSKWKKMLRRLKDSYRKLKP
jgi:alpha-1,3-rhamnosyltransferase